MSTKTKLNIQGNMDVHYAIYNDVFESLEAIDITNSIGQDQLLFGPSSDRTEIFLNNAENFLRLDDVFDIERGTVMSAVDMKKFFLKNKYVFLKGFSDINFYDANLYFFASSISSCYKDINQQVELRKDLIKEKLIEDDDSLFLVDTIFDSIETLEYIDTEATTAELDLQRGLAFSGQTTSIELRENDIDQKVISNNNLVVGDFLEFNLYSARDNQVKVQNYIVSRQLFVENNLGEVVLEVSINKNNIDLTDKKSLIINLPLNNGIEEIRILYKLVEEKDYREVFVTNPGQVVVRNLITNNKPVEDIKFFFVSNVPDGVGENIYHLFLVESILLLNKQTQSEVRKLVTKELSFDKDEKEYLFRKIKVQVNGKDDIDKFNAKAVVYYPAINKWSSEIDVKQSKTINITPATLFSNKDDRNTQLVVPFSPSSLDNICEIDYEILDSSILELDESFYNYQNILDPRELIVIRDVGGRGLFSSNTSNLLSENPSSGWQFFNNKYTTYVFVEESQIKTVDFGSKSLIINGDIVSGEYNFKEGLYKVEILEENWLNIQDNQNEEGLQRLDLLYPFNHKYLIEGYLRSSVYKGFSVYGKQSCSFVDSNYLLFGEWKRNISGVYPPIYSLYHYDDNGTRNSKVILPIDTTYRDFYKERVIVIGKKFQKSLRANKVILTFDVSNKEANNLNKDEDLYIYDYSLRVV